MFPLSVFTHRRVKKSGIIMLGIGGALLIASVLAPASGAWFFDSKEGHASITTSSIGLGLANGDGSTQGTFDLAFDGLDPGTMQSRTFTITNSGQVTGTLALTSEGVESTGGASRDPNSLYYQIDGFGSVPLSSGQGAGLDLGLLQPGETRDFTMLAGLDQNAGNEWQGVSMDHTLKVTMTQAH